MGVPDTGILTSDQFDRLAEASGDIGAGAIGLPGKIVFMTEDATGQREPGLQDDGTQVDDLVTAIIKRTGKRLRKLPIDPTVLKQPV